jgi:SAM-dependent methyltransferase
MIIELKDTIDPKIYRLGYLTRKATIKNLKQAINQLPDRKLRILDAGCGPKSHKKFFEGKIGKYVCLDITPGDGIDYVAPVEKIPLPPGSFDVVIAIEVLEHVNDPQKAISEFHRVLDKGGVVFATVPVIWEEHNDFQRWTSAGFRRFFASVFDEVEVKANGGSMLALFEFFNLYVHHFIPDRIKFLRAPFYIVNNTLGGLMEWLIPCYFIKSDLLAIAKKK